MRSAPTHERGNRALRAADRYVGIPLVVAGGCVLRPRPRPSRIGRIGVLNSTAVGDTVLLAPVLEDVAAGLPDSEVILFTTPGNVPLARLFKRVLPVPIELSRPRAALRAIRGAGVDVMLDFASWPRVTAALCLFSGASWTAGFRSPGQYRHYAYDAIADHSAALHELENYRVLAGLLGAASASTPRVVPPRALGQNARPRSPYAVLHLWPTGYRSDLKEWPWERWQQLAAEFARRGITPVLTGSTADVSRSRAFMAWCGATALPLVDVTGKFDLAELSDLLADSRYVVSVNTGVAHLAAAVGAPTIVLNGPTSERRWGPLGGRAVSVNSPLDDCGYLRFGWEYRGRRENCMDGISVEAVVHAVGKLGEL